jgi:hypothetical protein
MRHWIGSVRALWAEPKRVPALRIFLLTVFYLAVFAGLAALYGPGHFHNPGFVYQDF